MGANMIKLVFLRYYFLVAACILIHIQSYSQTNMIINEVLADPPPLIEGDANGDGIRDSYDDEFIELINNSVFPINISNWTLSDSDKVRHTFPIGTLIQPGYAIVIFGGDSIKGDFGGALVQVANGGTHLNLNNKGDQITLKNGIDTIAVFTYGNEGDDGQSLARNPDLTGSFARHDLIATNVRKFSPGRSNVDNSPFPLQTTISASMVDAIFTDNNFNNLANPGDIIKYTITITNTGRAVALGIGLNNTPDVNSTIVASSITTTQGNITNGNLGIPPVAVDIGNIAAGQSVAVEYKVRINNPFPAGPATITNQASISGSNVVGTNSDDPETIIPNDATVTSIFLNVPPNIIGLENEPINFYEGDNPISITSSASINDNDSPSMFSAEVRFISNYNPAEDFLTCNNFSNITANFDSNTGVLSLTGVDTKNNYQTILRSVQYSNSNTLNPSMQTRVIGISVNDGEANSVEVTRNINVIGINDPSQISGIESDALVFVKGNPPVQLTNSISINDVDNETIQRAEIKISSNYIPGEDILVFHNTENITGSFNVTTGSLILAGIDSKENYQNALRSIEYQNINAKNPSIQNRNVSIKVYDGTDYSNSVSREVNIYSLNLTSTLNYGKWKSGNEINIAWQSNGINSIKMQYSTDGGTDWISIAGSVQASEGHYVWTVPNTPSIQCKIKIQDANNSLISDMSEGVFTICNLSITPPSPNENLLAGSMHSISWGSAEINNINIDYSTNGGSRWINIVSELPASLQNFNWALPLTSSAQCLLRIIDSEHPEIADTTHSYFKIVSLILTSPVEGDFLKEGNNHNITWKCGAVDNIDIDFTSDNGITWNEIAHTVSASTGNYLWEIPGITSKQYKIRIHDSSDSTIYDLNKNNFRVYKLDLLHPNSGEYFTSKSSQTIDWECGAIDSLIIEYSINNGFDWNLITVLGEPSAGKYDWKIPPSLSKSCMVKLSARENNVIMDQSDLAFTIHDLKINSTLEGRKIFTGEKEKITWNGSNINLVEIEYSTDNGLKWIPICTSTSSTNNIYNWEVPSTSSSICKLRIKNYYEKGMLTESGLFTIGKRNGDANNNGVVEAFDAVKVFQFVAGIITLTNEEVAELDLTGDNDLTALDAYYILYFVVNGSYPE